MLYRIMVLNSLWIAGAIAAWLHGHSGASHLVVVAEVEDVMEIEVLNVEDVVWSHFNMYVWKKEEEHQQQLKRMSLNIKATKNYILKKTNDLAPELT